MFGKEPGGSYQPYLDFLRVLATLFVIAIHTVSYAVSLCQTQSTAYRVLTLLVFTFVSCNLLFIMISGALLLPVNNESAGNFYRKRLLKVVLPLVVYYIFYVCAKEGIPETLSLRHLPKLFLRIISGAPEEAPHFWLIYVLVFLYVLTPLLRWIFQRVPDFVLRGLVGVIFLTNTLACYLPLWGVKIPLLQRIAESYAGVFVLGYYLACSEKKKADVFWLTAGGISWLFTAGLIFCTTDYESYIYGTAPAMMFYAAALFILGRNYIGQTIKPSQNGCRTPGWLLVRCISRYSYSILLIHWGVLHFFVKQILHVDVLSGGIVGGCLVMFLLTLIFSLLGAILIDNTVLKVLTKGLK